MTINKRKQLNDNFAFLPVGGGEEGERSLGVELLEGVGVPDEVDEVRVLGAALVQLGDDGAGALVDGAHDVVDDVDDAVAGLVVHRHHGAAVSGDLL